MATGSTAGPLGIRRHLANPAGPLWCNDNGCGLGDTPDPTGIRHHGPIRVADAETRKSKQPAKQPVSPAKVDTIFFHFYLPVTVKGDKPGKKAYKAADLFAWIQGTVDQYMSDRWSEEGIDVKLISDPKSGVADFKKSLQVPGAVVVYLGHSSLDARHDYRSLGLTPNGNAVPEIPSNELTSLLNRSKASLVILASCDSLHAVGKLTGGPVVIATDSGPDRETNTIEWAHALGAFFFLLLGFELDKDDQPTIKRKKGRATIDEALAATANAFKGTNDSFKLVHGDGSTQLFH